MTQKTWISDTSSIGDGDADEGGIDEQTPMEIEDDIVIGDAIECVGWWMAGVGTSDGMVVGEWATSKGGDTVYYVKKWHDSSDKGNDLIHNQIGEGPQIYGAHSYYLGTQADEVGSGGATYPVAHFSTITSGTAPLTRQLFLKCNASVNSDFMLGNNSDDTKHLSFIAVCRHHYAEDDLDSTGTSHTNVEDMGIVASAVTGEGEGWGLGFSEGNVTTTLGGTINMPTKASFGLENSTGDIHAYSSPTATGIRDVDNKYGILQVWQANGENDAPNNFENVSVGTFRPSSYNYVGQTYSDGTITESSGIGDGNLYIGKTKFNIGAASTTNPLAQNFEGRIVEMACWKSDNPISAYKRAQVLQYFKNKFSNDI